MKCRHCKVTMVEGVALISRISGTPEWPDSKVVTMSLSGEADMVTVLKCPECGGSVSRG
jgi:hypothetical protein